MTHERATAAPPTDEVDLEGFTLLDGDVQECPYPYYERMREDAPVIRDSVTGAYIVSRYEDIRDILADPATFSSRSKVQVRQVVFPERWARTEEMFQTRGWPHVPSLAGRDDPDHKQLRAIWDNAFRPSKMKDLEPQIQATIDQLFAGFIDAGSCDWVSQFSIQLPITTICNLLGAPNEVEKIRGWIDASMAINSMTLSEEEEIAATEQVIEAQHWYQQFIERVRNTPDNTLFSDVVNTVIPEWGRPLSEIELHASMFGDLFKAGSETTANALASGMKLLIEHPQAWDALKSDPQKHIRTFVEEVLRMESPTQGLQRTTTRDITLHGVDIPAGSMVHMRFGAANRDPRRWECPADLDLDRKAAAGHLAFSGGTHHCVGAPLARRELQLAFMTVVERMDNLRFAPGKNDFAHHRTPIFRGVRALHIEFTKRQPETDAS